MKSVQCGISELGLCEQLYWAKQGLSWITVCPTETFLQTFVKNRIDKLIENSEDYQASLPERGKTLAKQMHLKAFGKGSMKFIASESKVGFKEYPADGYTIEELDECNQDNTPFIEDRISNSEYKKRRIYANPTVSDFGVHKVFEKGTKERWHVKCPECGEWQHPTWFENVAKQIDEINYELRDKSPNPGAVCAFCDASIKARGHGEWVAECPGRDWRTFHVSQIISPQNTILELYNKFTESLLSETEKQRFWNSVLGLPYESPGARLSDALMNACIEEYSVSHQHRGPCIAGADIGSRNRMLVMDCGTGKPRLMYASLCSWSDMEWAIQHYNIDKLVIDAMPEQAKAKELRDKYPGRVWLCYYPHTGTDQTREPSIRDTDSDGNLICSIKVNRTESLDNSHGAIMNRLIAFPREAAGLAGGLFYTEMKGTTRIYDEERGLNEWTKGEDHFRHAFNYAWLAYGLLQKYGIYVDQMYEPENVEDMIL